MKPQATRVREPIPVDDYAALLREIRHQASIYRPDLRISGLTREGGRWYAVTQKGPISTSDCCKPAPADVVLTGSHDYA